MIRAGGRRSLRLMEGPTIGEGKKRAEFSKNSANPGGGVFDRSGYQGRTGCRKRQGAEAVDNGPAVSSAVVDIEVCRVLLDHGVVVIDEIVADVIDVGVIGTRWQTCARAKRTGLRVRLDEAETTAVSSAAEDCSTRRAVQLFIFGQVTDHKLVHCSVSVVWLRFMVLAVTHRVHSAVWSCFLQNPCQPGAYPERIRLTI